MGSIHGPITTLDCNRSSDSTANDVIKAHHVEIVTRPISA